MSDAPILDPITVVDDFEAADDFAKKHAPYMEACGGEAGRCVFVEVGHDVPHPNEPDHHIMWVSLYVGDSPVARFDLSPVTVQPKMSLFLDVPAGTTVRAIACCNLHGLWAHEITA